MAQRFTIPQRIKMLENYILTKNVEEVIRRYDELPKPTRKTVASLVKKFYETGSVLDSNGDRGRKRLRTEEHEDEVLDSLEDDPTLSSRSRSRSLSIPRTTLQRVIADLNYRAYRPHLLIDLTDEQKGNRVDFCHEFLKRVDDDPTFLQNIWFSDECRFSMDRVVNKTDCVYYAIENPHYTISVTHTMKSCMAWCAISTKGIIGPFFFDATVTSKSYIEMLRSQYIPALKEKGHYDTARFQQDGAAAHTALATREFLNREFHDKWIGLQGPLTWPAKSPDLTPPDFFLWGFLKSKVYEDSPGTVEELKAAIGKAVAEIPVEMCRKACENVSIRAKRCIDLKGETVGH
jgi:transposase